MTSRRGFLLGIGAVLAAPAIVKAESLMKIAVLRESVDAGLLRSAWPQWLRCDGRAVSRTTYPELFKAIGSVYGAGDGRTTFNLPDLRPSLAPKFAIPMIPAIRTVTDPIASFPAGAIASCPPLHLPSEKHRP